MRLLVDDEPFDVRYGELRRHERCLDLRAGLLDRQVEWVSPAGQAVRIRSRRMVSLSQRGIVALRYEVEPLEAEARVVVQSELVADEELVELEQGRPARRRRAEPPARGGGVHGRRRGRVDGAPHEGQRHPRRRGDGARRRRARRRAGRRAGRRDRRLGAHQLHRAAQARPVPGRRQARGVRLVRAPLAAGRARPGRRGADRGQLRRLGRAGRRAARVPRRVLGAGRRRGRRRPRAAAGRAASRSSTCCRPGPARSAARSPRRA